MIVNKRTHDQSINHTLNAKRQFNFYGWRSRVTRISLSRSRLINYTKFSTINWSQQTENWASAPLVLPRNKYIYILFLNSRMNASTRTRARFHLVFVLDASIVARRTQQTIDPNAIESSGELSSEFCFCYILLSSAVWSARSSSDSSSNGVDDVDFKAIEERHSGVHVCCVVNIDEANRKIEKTMRRRALQAPHNHTLYFGQRAIWCVCVCVRAAIAPSSLSEVELAASCAQ